MASSTRSTRSSRSGAKRKRAKKRTPVWDRPDPKRRPKRLSATQKRRAKARAKRAGRPYPNAVDNIAVAREG